MAQCCTQLPFSLSKGSFSQHKMTTPFIQANNDLEIFTRPQMFVPNWQQIYVLILHAAQNKALFQARKACRLNLSYS